MKLSYILPHSSFNLFEHVYEHLMGIVSADYHREGFDWHTLHLLSSLIYKIKFN